MFISVGRRKRKGKKISRYCKWVSLLLQACVGLFRYFLLFFGSAPCQNRSFRTEYLSGICLHFHNHIFPPLAIFQRTILVLSGEGFSLKCLLKNILWCPISCSSIFPEAFTNQVSRNEIFSCVLETSLVNSLCRALFDRSSTQFFQHDHLADLKKIFECFF